MPTKDYIFRFKQFLKRTNKKIKEIKDKIHWIFYCCSTMKVLLKANEITIDTKYWKPYKLNKDSSYPTLMFVKRDNVHD